MSRTEIKLMQQQTSTGLTCNEFPASLISLTWQVSFSTICFTTLKNNVSTDTQKLSLTA